MTDRITAADFKAYQAKPKSKYGNKVCRFNGERFDSKYELDRWIVLLDMQKRGEITDLRRQVSIVLEGREGALRGEDGRVLVYIADAVYTCTQTHVEIVEDAKGFRTDVFKLKKAILQAQGIDVVEV